MANFSACDAVGGATTLAELSSDAEIWQSLKQVIAASSGFHRWQQDRNLGTDSQGLSLDDQVRRYLRQTLETLAY